MASHLGGARDPMVIAWPGHIKGGGDLRTQFTHCIDIAPTILDLVGIPEPKVVDGIEQEPMDGTPFTYTFDDPAADERHTVQYFEMYGSRAIYKDGWWACARLDKLPWDFSPATLARFKPGSGYDPDQDKWELYYLPDDFSQAHDIAAENPRSSQSSGSSSGRRPPGTVRCRCWAAWPCSSASCRPCPRTRGTRSRATSRTSRPR